MLYLAIKLFRGGHGVLWPSAHLPGGLSQLGVISPSMNLDLGQLVSEGRCHCGAQPGFLSPGPSLPQGREVQAAPRRGLCKVLLPNIHIDRLILPPLPPPAPPTKEMKRKKKKEENR